MPAVFAVLIVFAVPLASAVRLVPAPHQKPRAGAGPPSGLASARLIAQTSLRITNYFFFLATFFAAFFTTFLASAFFTTFFAAFLAAAFAMNITSSLELTRNRLSNDQHKCGTALQERRYLLPSRRKLTTYCIWQCHLYHRLWIHFCAIGNI